MLSSLSLSFAAGAVPQIFITDQAPSTELRSGAQVGSWITVIQSGWAVVKARIFLLRRPPPV